MSNKEKEDDNPDPVQEGQAAATRLGASVDSNPYVTNPDAINWKSGFQASEENLLRLFDAWLSLGYSLPVVGMGRASAASGPLVAALMAENGNAAAVVFTGAMFFPERERIRPGESAEVSANFRIYSKDLEKFVAGFRWHVCEAQNVVGSAELIERGEAIECVRTDA